jgi:hypothetical protein
MPIISKKNILVISKENLPDFIIQEYCGHRGETFDKLFEESLRKLCRIMPEFTHRPVLNIAIEPFEGELKPVLVLKFDSSVYYDENLHTSCRFLPSFFSLDANKIRDEKEIQFNIRSFGIKESSWNRIVKMSGEATADTEE